MGNGGVRLPVIRGWFPAPVGCAVSSMRRRRFWLSLWARLVGVLVAELAAAHQSAPLTRMDVEAFADSFFARYLREYPEPSLALAVVQDASRVNA